MSDRGKSEFNTMDITIGDVENKNFEPSVLKGFDSLDESIVIKETSKEHYANRFMTAAPGKENISNLEKIKDTSMANDAFKKYNKLHSGLTIEDDAQKGKIEENRRIDKRINDYSKDMNKRLQGSKSDIEKHRANQFLNEQEALRKEKIERLTSGYQPKPIPLTDAEKYDKALHIQNRNKVLENARKLMLSKKKSLLKVIKEFNLYEE